MQNAELRTQNSELRTQNSELSSRSALCILHSSVTQVRVVRCRFDHHVTRCSGCWPMNRHRLHVTAHRILCGADSQLGEQERELLIIRPGEFLTRVAIEFPECALERAK